MTQTRKVFATAGAGALALFVLLPISGARAQSMGSSGDSGASASAPAQGAQIDDATLQKAAKAYVKVNQIRSQAKPGTDSNGAQPDQTAESQKIAAVRNEGLDPKRYNEVLIMVQNDPSLQQKFVGYVNQNGGESN